MTAKHEPLDMSMQLVNEINVNTLEVWHWKCECVVNIQRDTNFTAAIKIKSY